MSDNKNFIDLLKKYTDINKTFIDTFFKKFKIGGELEFDIKDKIVAEYLEITLTSLRKRLRNQSNSNSHEIFYENIDYVKIKGETTSSVTYMLNYSGFERIAMTSNSQKAESVRLYFIKLREFLVDNQHLFYQSMTNKEELKKYAGFETIYFFAVDTRQNFFKVGRTIDILQRLRNYNVGRIKEVELKYLAIVKNAQIIEKCIGIKLNKHRVEEHKEIFYVNPKKLKKIIDECYCKHVTKKEHDEMLNDLTNLLGLYSYIKNKVNIKPYMIIRNI